MIPMLLIPAWNYSIVVNLRLNQVTQTYCPQGVKCLKENRMRAYTLGIATKIIDIADFSDDADIIIGTPVIQSLVGLEI